MAAHEVVVQFTDQHVAEAFVELPGARIDRGDAEEHIGKLAKDALLGEADEARSDPAATSVRADADDLDVADECPLQHEDHESSRDAAVACHPYFSGRVGHAGQALLDGFRAPRQFQSNIRTAGADNLGQALLIFIVMRIESMRCAESSRPFAATVKGAKLIVLQGVGHMVQYAAPDLVVDEIEAMVGRVRQSTAKSAHG